MRVLVTGGSGFIGGAIVRRLEDCGWDVDIFSLQPPNYATRANFIWGDILEEEQLAKLGKYSVVIHMAGSIGASLTFDSIIDTEIINVIGTLNLLEKFKDCDVFIQPSLNGDWLNPYMISKRAAERYGFMYGQNNPMKYISVRLTDVYGPSQSVKHGKAVPKFITEALVGAPLPVYGSGNYEMRLMYVDDVAKVIVGIALDMDDIPTMVSVAPLHIDNNISVKNLASMIIRMIKSDSRIDYCPMRKGQPKDVTGYDVDIDQSKWLLTKLGKLKLL